MYARDFPDKGVEQALVLEMVNRSKVGRSLLLFLPHGAPLGEILIGKCLLAGSRLYFHLCQW
jgi:hypothetical protein